MSGAGCMDTGHDEFDRLAIEFSAIIKEIETELYERARDDGENDNDNVNVNGNVNDDRGRRTTESIRKASSILAKMSSVTKSTVIDTEESGLKQELVDVYKACKMQLKTYKSLNQQPELFCKKKATKSSLSTTTTTTSASERSILFSSASGPTEGSADGSSSRCDRGGTKNSNNNYDYNKNRSRDRIASNTLGRVGKQNSRLQDALRSIHESEQVAQEISGELQSQRESLGRTQGRMGEFSSMTKYSNELLNSMNKPWWRKW